MKKLSLEELNRVDVDSYHQQPKIKVLVVLDSIRSALNVGSIFRSADAFNIEELVICGYTACPPHKEITKTAIGATESVKWRYSEDVYQTVIELKQMGYVVIGIEQTNTSVALETFPFSSQNKYALVFGNEVDGINDAILPEIDHSIEIRQFGTKHSLNVAVCAGIVMYYVNLKLS